MTKKYNKPKISSEILFERSVLACNNSKVNDGKAGCTAPPKS